MNAVMDYQQVSLSQQKPIKPHLKMAAVLLRFVHGAITVFFLSCIGYIYFAGITNTPGIWSTLALASLVLEGLVVFLNKGECPLGPLHRKLGDQKTFFELVLPRPLAKRAVPFFGLVTVVGAVLLVV